jgi:hypothetical protein
VAAAERIVVGGVTDVQVVDARAVGNVLGSPVVMGA